MKTVLKVIERYNSHNGFKYKQQCTENEKHQNNYLGLMIYLLDDYYQNHLYNNKNEIYDVNGDGSIAWTKTIDEMTPFIQDNVPYYLDYYSNKNIDDEYDYFHELHAFIVTECSKQINELGLNDIFGFENIHISDKNIKEFGDKTYILKKIRQEQAVQFETRKLQLLTVMYYFIEEQFDRKLMNCNESFQLFGTKRFENVWEDIVRKVFSDKLYEPLKRLPINLLPEDNENDKLIDLICKPVWNGDGVKKTSQKTLRPDTILIENKDDVITFAILDAKYYSFQLQHDKPLKGPGVEDIVKQYLYQMAYEKFAASHDIKNIRNCFLMPTEENEIKVVGNVDMEIFSKLETIRIRLLPLDLMMNMYLSKKTMSISNLQLNVKYKNGITFA